MSTRTPTILIVDDNPSMRRLLYLALSHEGYNVIEAEGGRSALSAIVEHTPDLVVQDLMLPDIPGIELVRRLRALPAGATIPILALSGFPSMAGMAEKRSGSFTQVLCKPILPSHLVAIVQGYLPFGAQLASSVVSPST